MDKGNKGKEIEPSARHHTIWKNKTKEKTFTV